jgi:hypothetical protein
MREGKIISFRLNDRDLEHLDEFTKLHGFKSLGISAKRLVIHSLLQDSQHIRNDQIDLLSSLKKISRAVDIAIEGNYFEVKMTGGNYNQHNNEELD